MFERAAPDFADRRRAPPGSPRPRSGAEEEPTVSKSPRKPPRPSTPAATARATRALPPWLIAALRDAVIAELAVSRLVHLVADWPEAHRRVGDPRRYRTALRRGEVPPAALLGDVGFAASLLARICEADFGLGMTDIVAMLDQLGLPVDDVALAPRAQPSAELPVAAEPSPCDECRHRPLFRNAA
jgi:hypothetical protein